MGRTTAAMVALLLPIATLAAAPQPVPESLRMEWKLDLFYQRYADAGGLPVVGSVNVSENALSEAAWIVGRMLEGRQDILNAMRKARVRMVVMAATESTTDIPEHSRLTPKLYWDRRARGLGATPANPAVSCGEENLLGYPGDPYPGENILIHEFAHAIHGTGLNAVDPTFDRRLRAAFQSAMDRGLWNNTYAATNHSEYWAEGVQSWFDDNALSDALHNDIRTRARLKEYDPGLAKLCAEVFGDGQWRYQRPSLRSVEDRTHLTSFDARKLPVFRWREAPIGDTARVMIETAAGNVEVEIEARGAPEATQNFLKVALVGGYHGAKFTRPNSSDDAGRWGEVVVNPEWWKHHGKEIEMKSIPLTKAKLAPGMLALVRDGERFAGFVLYVDGPFPAGREVVPLGRILRGLEVVEKLVTPPAPGGDPNASSLLRRVIRTQ